MCCLTTDVKRIYTGLCVIQDYRDRRTEAFAAGEYVPAFQSFEQQAAHRLSILNAARSLDTAQSTEGQPSGSAERSPGRAVLHKNQSAVADLLQLA